MISPNNLSLIVKIYDHKFIIVFMYAFAWIYKRILVSTAATGTRRKGGLLSICIPLMNHLPQLQSCNQARTFMVNMVSIFIA